jgi:YD repeat-containing protein
VVAFLLDLAGNKTRTTWADGYYVTYAYDALGRMATENGTFLLSTYIYDKLGDMILEWTQKVRHLNWETVLGRRTECRRFHNNPGTHDKL